MKPFREFISESQRHHVFVRDYGNGSDINTGKSDLDHNDFHSFLKNHNGKYEYSADKGVGFSFDHKHKADSFVKSVNSRFKNLNAGHE